MKELIIRLTGTVPIMLHSNQMVNPLNRYTKVIKPLTGKRKKTDEDILEIARIEWEAGLYVDKEMIVVPGRCLDATFREGAKRTKEGKKWIQGAMVMDDSCLLEYKGKNSHKFTPSDEIPNPKFNELFKTNCNIDMVKIGQQTILRARPIFYDWSLDVTIAFDEKVFDQRGIESLVAQAGQYVGLCERRPRYGKFDVEVVE